MKLISFDLIVTSIVEISNKNVPYQVISIILFWIIRKDRWNKKKNFTV